MFTEKQFEDLKNFNRKVDLLSSKIKQEFQRKYMNGNGSLDEININNIGWETFLEDDIQVFDNLLK